MTPRGSRTRRGLRRIRRIVAIVIRTAVGATLAAVVVIVSVRWIDPPTTPLMVMEGTRLDRLEHDWVPLERIAPVMPRSAVAAEDANFCSHWGFDLEAIREVLEEGQNRGASTISQQVAKNVFLWPQRSWLRKGLEAAVTVMIEFTWPKDRIIEVYLNVAEFGEGVFGVEAAARHWFGVSASDLSATQAARLAAILPAPRLRDPNRRSDFMNRRSGQIADGAATILRDGRAACLVSP